MKKIKIKKKIILSTERKRILSSEVSRLICDNSKLIKNTNWKKRTSLDKGLAKTINWIKKNKEFFKTRNYNL